MSNVVNIADHKKNCSGNKRCKICNRLGCSVCIVGEIFFNTDKRPYNKKATHGLCIVCIGDYEEGQLILHEIPSNNNWRARLEKFKKDNNIKTRKEIKEAKGV